MKVIMEFSCTACDRKNAANRNRIIKFACVLIKADHALPVFLRRAVLGGSMGMRDCELPLFACAIPTNDPK